MVARLNGVQEAAGSTPVTRTKSIEIEWFRCFFVFLLHYCLPFGGFTDIGNFDLLFSIPAAILGLIGAEKEYCSHAEVLFRADNKLSEKWTKLRKMYVISIVATIGGAVLVLFGLIGLLINLAGVVLAVIVSIKQLIYLYYSKGFKDV